MAVELRKLGHSYRAIGGALGVSHEQARKDVAAGIVNDLPIPQPERVIRQGGGTYPASRPKPTIIPRP